MSFKEDLQSFISLIQSSSDEAEIKKEYISLVKKISSRQSFGNGHDILHAGKNSLEVMQHYWNAIKCYKYIIQHCKDEVLIYSAKFDYQMVTDANNILARTLALSGNEIMIKEN